MGGSQATSGRYSHIVATFEHDGKRYVVAEDEHLEPVDTTSPRPLSPRERTVLLAASAGQHDKLIAYELGVADSTVRVLFFRAMRKLGAANRADALARFAGESRTNG